MKNWAAILAAIVMIGAWLATIYYLGLFLMMVLLGLRVWWLLAFGLVWLGVVYASARVIDKVVK